MRKAIIALLLFALCACERATVDLGRGYKLVGLDGRNAAVEDRDNRMVVDPNITRYKVLGSYVVGERENANIDARLSKRYGFFVLDMRSGRLIEGLDRAGFESAMRARNLGAPPF